jgi:hypothetical protein
MFTISLSTVQTNLMTLPDCMGKVEEYSGVCLSVVSWLKTKDFLLFVGENTLYVDADEQPAIEIQLPKLSTQQWEHFHLIVNVLHSSHV